MDNPSPFPTQDQKPPVKPGYQTSEFWLTTLTTVSTLAGVLSGVVPAEAGAILATVSTVAYQVSRFFLKRG